MDSEISTLSDVSIQCRATLTEHSCLTRGSIPGFGVHYIFFLCFEQSACWSQQKTLIVTRKSFLARTSILDNVCEWSSKITGVQHIPPALPRITSRAESAVLLLHTQQTLRLQPTCFCVAFVSNHLGRKLSQLLWQNSELDYKITRDHPQCHTSAFSAFDMSCSLQSGPLCRDIPVAYASSAWCQCALSVHCVPVLMGWFVFNARLKRNGDLT